MSLHEERLFKVEGRFRLFIKKDNTDKKPKIIRITDGMFSVSLGQLVKARDYRWVPKGTLGIVVEILVPYEDEHTSKVIRVWFVGCQSPYLLEIGELKLEPC